MTGTRAGSKPATPQPDSDARVRAARAIGASADQTTDGKSSWWRGFSIGLVVALVAGKLAGWW